MQWIDLYKPSPVEEKILLSVQHILIIVVIFISALSLVSLSGNLATRNIRYSIKLLKKELAEVQNELVLLSSNLPTDSEQRNLLKKAEDLGKIKTLREDMFSKLRDLKKDDVTGFSTYLYALSKYRVDGIWLTKFNITQRGGNIVLEGYTRYPSLIPKLVAKFGEEPVFRDKKFESLTIVRDEKQGGGVVKFVLQSD